MRSVVDERAGRSTDERAHFANAVANRSEPRADKSDGGADKSNAGANRSELRTDKFDGGADLINAVAIATNRGAE